MTQVAVLRVAAHHYDSRDRMLPTPPLAIAAPSPVVELLGITAEPAVAAVLAALIIVGVLIATRPLPVRGRADLSILRIGALAVFIAIALEAGVAHLVVDLATTIEWWQYALPLMGAALVVVALLVYVRRLPATPEVPTAPTARRDFATFATAPNTWLPVLAGAVLLITIVVAGLASSANEQGQFVHLDVPVPNTDVDPMRPTFFGWAYGLPVLASLVILAVVVVWMLQLDAARPFRKPETAEVERNERTQRARGVLLLASGAALLALGEAWRLIGHTAAMANPTIGDVPVSTGWGAPEIAGMIGSLAGIPTIAGCVLLGLLVLAPAGVIRRRAVLAPAAAAVTEA